MNDIDAVRLKTSDRSAITREEAKGDDVTRYFKLGHNRIITTPDIEVRINDVLQGGGYTVDYENGIVIFTVPPAGQTGTTEADLISFVYYWSIFSDAEVQYFLDDSGGNVTIASAKLLLATAADASKVAQRQSMAGGGGLGSVTLDTSVTSRELRATAQALVSMEGDIGTSIPAEGLTEPNWTEQVYQQSVGQRIIRHG